MTKHTRFGDLNYNQERESQRTHLQKLIDNLVQPVKPEELIPIRAESRCMEAYAVNFKGVKGDLPEPEEPEIPEEPETPEPEPETPTEPDPPESPESPEETPGEPEEPGEKPEEGETEGEVKPEEPEEVPEEPELVHPEFTLDSYKFSKEENNVVIHLSSDIDFATEYLAHLYDNTGRLIEISNLANSLTVKAVLINPITNGLEYKLVIKHGVDLVIGEFDLIVEGVQETIVVPEPIDVKIEKDAKTVTGKIVSDNIPKGLMFRVSDPLLKENVNDWVEVAEDGSMKLVSDFYFYEGGMFELDFKDMGEDVTVPRGTMISPGELIEEPVRELEQVTDAKFLDSGKKIEFTPDHISGATLTYLFKEGKKTKGMLIVPFSDEKTPVTADLRDAFEEGETCTITAKDFSGKIPEKTVATIEVVHFE